MRFHNREEAALLLAKKLEQFRGQDPLVLGIPRGAIPMAKIIAEHLEGELGAILVHKIPAPFNEELAIGSIGLSGEIQRLDLIEALRIPETYLQQAAKRQMELLQYRQKQYGLTYPHYQDRTVIIVDDGIATGATTLSAVHEIKNFKPKTIIVAAAVASIEAAAKLRQIADEVIVLDEPVHFYAVGQFFDDFRQVDDEEVIASLKSFHAKTPKPKSK